MSGAQAEEYAEIDRVGSDGLPKFSTIDIPPIAPPPHSSPSVSRQVSPRNSPPPTLPPSALHQSPASSSRKPRTPRLHPLESITERALGYAVRPSPSGVSGARDQHDAVDSFFSVSDQQLQQAQEAQPGHAPQQQQLRSPSRAGCGSEEALTPPDYSDADFGPRAQLRIGSLKRTTSCLWAVIIFLVLLIVGIFVICKYI
jgi:hypothetical protein